MARLFFPTSGDTVTCKRCGSDIPGDADTCPQCGADHGPGFGVAKSAALPAGLRLPFGARREALNIQSSYPNVPEVSELADAGEQRWDASKIVLAGVVALVVAAGGIIYSQRGSSGSSDDAARSQVPARHSEYGVIDMKTAQGAPAPAVTPAPTAAPDKSMTAASPAPAVPTPAPSVAPSIAARETLPAPELSGRTKAALANAVDNLQATRDAIGRADLTTARKRYAKIPASQLGSGYAQRTLADLTAQEHARDQMLQAARDCASTGSWLCVRQNAHDALAIDASNLEAQALVERAISRSGWLNKPAPATTTAHGTSQTHNKTQTAALVPAAPAPAPVVVPVPRVATTPAPATTHKPTATASAAEHSRAVAAMGVPSPVTPHAPVATTAVAPVAPVATVAPVTPAAPVAATAMQSAPEAARIGTGSQTQLTSAPYPPPPPPSSVAQQAAPLRAPVATFIPMPDGPETMPATAPEHSAPAAAQGSGEPASPLVVSRPLAPNSNTVPARAAVVSPTVAANVPPPGAQGMTRQASPTVHRTVASADNAASAPQPHASAFNASDPDEEERAILQSGWSKKPSSAQRAAPQ